MTPSVQASIHSLRTIADIIQSSMVEEVYLEDTSSGRVHVGFQREIDAAPATFEACNQDDAGPKKVITEAEANTKPDKLRCLRCFVRRNVPTLPEDSDVPLEVEDADVGEAV